MSTRQGEDSSILEKKAWNINIITKAFGGENFLEIPLRRDCTKKKAKSLQFLCKEKLLSDEYKLKPLQVSLANAIHREKQKKWREKCKINMFGYIPHLHDGELIISYFSYPEFNLKRKQIEHRTLDYSHILTNMKTHILTKGYDFCKKEHFQELAHLNPDLLSRPLVYDNIDQ